jgi:SAM-dependent methyltransferase
MLSRTFTLVAILLFVAASSFGQTDSTVDTLTTVGLMKQQAESLATFVSSDIAKQFLAAVPTLPSVAPRTVYVNKQLRQYLSEAEFAAATDSGKAGFEKRDLDEGFYYFTRYGTPLAFVRALDLVGQAGLKSLDGARIADFGFGSIGHLKLLAANGAHVVGIDIDPLLKLLYSQPGDVGEMQRAPQAGAGKNGNLTLAIGSFPSDSAIRATVGTGYDLFISKNTLKHGYIHPEREVDPRMLVHLGVDDSAFVQTIYNLLKPGGYFMIYNLHPKLLTPEEMAAPDAKYLPWSDGRCPFTRELLEQVGFTVLGYNVDDTEPARAMGNRFGWDKEMNYDKDLYGQYTLVRK